jgi:hypothetical protein
VATERRTDIVLMVTCAALAGHACTGSSQSESPFSEVSVALTSVPSGVGCIVLDATPVGTSQPITKSTSVKSGAATSFTLGGLPSGQVTFEGWAFAGSCPPSSSALPLWVSRPVTITLTAGTTTPLTLLMEKSGQANVSLDFGGPTCTTTGWVSCQMSDGTVQCVNPQSDSQNCGACGKVCGAGQSCSAGACVNQVANGGTCQSNGQCVSGNCSNTTCCAAGQTGCSGACVDLSTSNAHCGACSGTVCTPGAQQCSGGRCLLADGQPCSSASQCLSGVCPQFYLDGDGDGYPVQANPRGYCNTNTPPGVTYMPARSDGKWDCCDVDLTVNPGVTDYFTYPNATYGWDWNCSGALEKQPIDIVSCVPDPTNTFCVGSTTQGTPSGDCGSSYGVPSCTQTSSSPLTCSLVGGHGGTVQCH